MQGGVTELRRNAAGVVDEIEPRHQDAGQSGMLRVYAGINDGDDPSAGDWIRRARVREPNNRGGGLCNVVAGYRAAEKRDQGATGQSFKNPSGRLGQDWTGQAVQGLGQGDGRVGLKAGDPNICFHFGFNARHIRGGGSHNIDTVRPIMDFPDHGQAVAGCETLDVNGGGDGEDVAGLCRRG